MNEKMLDVKDLITAVDKEIVFLHYCEGHIRHHRECWNVLRKYMENRLLFSYLHEEGIYPCDIQGIWPNVRVEQYCNLPETISPDEAKRLLDAVDRGNALGKRNYAILLIAIRYGLRVSDIRALEFCNVD